MSRTDASLRTLVIVAAAVAAVAAAAYLGRALVVGLAPYLADPVALRATIRGFGLWAPVAFVALQAVQIVVAPVPGGTTGVIAGFLFGPLVGTLLTAVGGAIGSFVAFWLSRRYGRPLAERFVAPETLAEFDAAAGDHGAFVLFVVFLLPGFPDDAICFLGGLTDIDLRTLVAISVVGRLPTHFLTNLAGARLLELRYAEVAAILGGLALISVVVYLRGEALVRWAERLAPR